MTTSTSSYVGDVGTQVILDTGVDLSTAVDQSIKVKKPSGTTVTWAGSVVETTKVSYTTGTGDFDETGIYKFQAYVQLPAWNGHGDTVGVRITGLFGG